MSFFITVRSIQVKKVSIPENRDTNKPKRRPSVYPLRGAASGELGRAAREGRDVSNYTALLPSTRSSTPRQFRCICASSGTPVTYNSSSSWFMV
jgi:hypothetical protein